MKCRKCGNPVREIEPRCSVCGARVIKEPLSLSKRRKSASPIDIDGIEDSVFQGYIPPEEQFNWNTDGFPGEKSPTKDIQFNWNTFDQFHESEEGKVPHKEGDEIAFGEDLLPSEEDMEEEKVIWNEPFEIPIAPDATSEEPKQLERSTESLEAESILQRGQEGSLEEPLTGEEDVTGQRLEEELFEEIRQEQRNAPTPVSVTDAMAAHTVSTDETDHGQIDQFYTFNRKNEEFQRLLDKEYEKYRSGRRDSDWEQESEEYSSSAYDQDQLIPSETQMPACLTSLINDREEEKQSESKVQEEQPVFNDLEKDILPREVIPEIEESINPSEKIKDAVPEEPKKQKASKQPVEPEKTGEKTPEEQLLGKQKLDEGAPDVVNRQEITVKAESLKEKTPETVEEKALPIETPEQKQETVAAESIPGKKSRKSRQWVMIVLITVLALLVVLATALVAPNSFPGRWLHSIFDTAQVEKQEPLLQKTGPKDAAKDKTGIIQLVVKEEKNLSLTKVAYNSQLQYRDNQVYEDKTIKNSKPLKKNKKHIDDQGNKVPLDQALVKATIDYADSHMTPQGKDKELKIGQIRYTEKAYYVWVSENSIKKIYRIDDSKGTMQVSGIVQM